MLSDNPRWVIALALASETETARDTECERIRLNGPWLDLTPFSPDIQSRLAGLGHCVRIRMLRNYICILSDSSTS
jgi:hypothetical protein